MGATRLLRPVEVYTRTGLSRMTVWRLRHLGQFPAPVQASERRVAYREDQVDEWIASRMPAANDRRSPGRGKDHGRASRKGRQATNSGPSATLPVDATFASEKAHQAPQTGATTLLLKRLSQSSGDTPEDFPLLFLKVGHR